MGPPISAVAPLHTGPPSSDKQLHLSLAQHGDGDGTKSFDDKGDRALISDVRPTTPKSLASRGTGGTGDARVSSKGMFYPHTERICDIRGETFDSEATAMFIDPEKMKEGVRKALLRPAYDVRDFYHKQGLWQHIARNHVFEHITLAVIGVNALWMMIDTDNNSAPTLLEAEPIFQIAEHSFCFYFSFEWFVRFMAFEHKRDGMKDAWFVFDSMLVFMMVLETWLMTIIIAATGAGSSGGMGNTGILRLFRLLRLSRMARMLRSMPELMILIKGMVAATRSVFFTLCLLLIIMYVFAIAFTQLCADSEVGELYFSTILGSMYTLLIVGTFFDNLGDVVTDVGRASYIYAALFMLFIALAALMVMNMLIGVLCEVVSAVATTEKEGMLVSFVRSKMLEVVKALDVDGDMMISKAEFVQIMENHDAVSALQEVDVDPVGLVDMVDFIFEKENEDDEDEENSLSFCDFMDVILELRGNNTATVKDVVDLQKFMTQGIKRFEDRLSRRSSLTSSRSSWKSTPPAQQSSEEQAQSSPPDQRTGAKCFPAAVPNKLELHKHLGHLDAFLTAGRFELHQMRCIVEGRAQLSGGCSIAESEVSAQMNVVEELFSFSVEALQKARSEIPQMSSTNLSECSGTHTEMRLWMARFESFVISTGLSELHNLRGKLCTAAQSQTGDHAKEIVTWLSKVEEYFTTSVAGLRRMREGLNCDLT